MSTLSELKDKVQSELRMNTSYRVFSEDIVRDAINQGRFKVQSEGYFRWVENEAEHSFSTVASTATYALPARFIKLDGSVFYNNSPLIGIRYEDLLRQNPDLTPEGTPSHYSLRGANMRLFLVPNEIKTVKYTYRVKLADLSADADDNVFGADFDEAIVQYACFILYKRILGKEQKALSCMQVYEEKMKELRTAYLGDAARNDSFLRFGFETI